MNASVCFCIASNLKDTLTLLKFVCETDQDNSLFFALELMPIVHFKQEKERTEQASCDLGDFRLLDLFALAA